jgi:hypothetical protein
MHGPGLAEGSKDGTGGEVPDFVDAIGVPGHDGTLAVGGSVHFAEAVVALPDQLFLIDIPETKGVVTGAEKSAVGQEPQPDDDRRVAFEQGDEFSGFDIPDAHGPVVAGGRDTCAIVGDGDREDVACMGFEGANDSPGRYVPDLNLLIPTAGDGGPVIGKKGDAEDRIGVSRKGALEEQGAQRVGLG